MNDFETRVLEVSDILKVLSHKDRLMILCYLNKDEKNVSDIVEKIGISQSQISQYLQKMKMLRIVESNKSGKEVLYKISDMKVLEIIGSLKKIYS